MAFEYQSTTADTVKKLYSFVNWLYCSHKWHKYNQKHPIVITWSSSPVMTTLISYCMAHLSPTFINFQNTLTRTVTQSPQSIRASQLLSNLHWLAINKRISFKIVILTYKVLSTQQPTYPSSLISYRHSSRLLRSNGKSLLLNVPEWKPNSGVVPSPVLHKSGTKNTSCH